MLHRAYASTSRTGRFTPILNRCSLRWPMGLARWLLCGSLVLVACKSGGSRPLDPPHGGDVRSTMEPSPSATLGSGDGAPSICQPSPTACFERGQVEAEKTP